MDADKLRAELPDLLQQLKELAGTDLSDGDRERCREIGLRVLDLD